MLISPPVYLSWELRVGCRELEIERLKTVSCRLRLPVMEGGVWDVCITSAVGVKWNLG